MGCCGYMGHGLWLVCEVTLAGEQMVFVGIKIVILVEYLYGGYVGVR